jgi:excisionase family DNA binding protein
VYSLPKVAEILTVNELAQRSKLGEKAVRNAIRRGELRASKLCGRWRIRESDYEAWVEAGTYVPLRRTAALGPPVSPRRGSLSALKRIEDEAA